MHLRPYRAVTIAALAAALLLFSPMRPASAQAAPSTTTFRPDGPQTPPPAATPALPDSIGPIYAQSGQPQNIPVLAIPAPPNSTVVAEVDVQDADLLGVYKSLLRGVGQGGSLIPAVLPSTATPREQALNAQLRALFTNYDLADILKDTTHIHMMVFTVPGGMAMGTDDAPVTAKAKAAKARAAATTSDQTPFYETTFAGEGGHRMLFLSVAPAHILMTSFGHLGGYALMVQGPGVVAVLRANGYPDLSKLSALATQASILAAEIAVPMVEAAAKTRTPKSKSP